MYKTRKFEFPQSLIGVYKKAKNIEFISICYLFSIIILEYLVMGNIQTMKTVWLEDILSLAAPLSFLVTSKIYLRSPTARFPYGFHSVVKIAFLIGSVALMSIGLFLLFDGLHALISKHHPKIPTITVLNHQVWMGYLIILVMTYKIIAPFILGHIKIKLAKELHDKTLFVDGHTNRADWLAAMGAIAGVITIGLGWWWSDAIIAIIISLDIFVDGFNNTKRAIFDLIDERPTTVDGKAVDPVVKKIHDYLKSLHWIKEVELRLREDGHVYFGEAIVVPRTTENLLSNISAAINEIRNLNWKLHDFLICPVDEISKM